MRILSVSHGSRRPQQTYVSQIFVPISLSTVFLRFEVQTTNPFAQDGIQAIPGQFVLWSCIPWNPQRYIHKQIWSLSPINLSHVNLICRPARGKRAPHIGNSEICITVPSRGMPMKLEWQTRLWPWAPWTTKGLHSEAECSECKGAEQVGSPLSSGYNTWCQQTALSFSLSYTPPQKTVFPNPHITGTRCSGWGCPRSCPLLTQTKTKIWNQRPAACLCWYWFWSHDSLMTLGHILSVSQNQVSPAL